MSKVVVLVEFTIDSCDIRKAVSRLEDHIEEMGQGEYFDALIADAQYETLSAVLKVQS